MVAEVWGSGSPGRVRSTGSWVVWNNEIARLMDVALATGTDPERLLHWLEYGAPLGGGRLAGRAIRWASTGEAAAADLNPPPWSGPIEGQGSWVRWRSPDGRVAQMPLERAARRLRQDDHPCPPVALLQVLKAGPWVHRGNQLELIRAPGNLAHLDDYRVEEPDDAPPPVVKPTPGDRPLRHPYYRGRPTLVNGRRFPSVAQAAARLPISKQRLQQLLRAADGDPIEVQGFIIQFAEEFQVSQAIAPSIEQLALPL